MVGSISHTADTCIAVIGSRDQWTSIGIDIEPETGIEESLWDIICKPEERRALQRQSPPERGLFAKRVFVAKEAFYKWYYPQKGKLLDFQKVAVKWNPAGTGYSILLEETGSCEHVTNCHGQIFSFEGKVAAFCMSRVLTDRHDS